MRKKIVIATGGTGGHVFPSQAFAKQMQDKSLSCDILFMGHGLSTNKYFHQELFAYQSIDSATVFKKKWFQKIFSIGMLLKGVFQSAKLLKQFSPHVVVGFGSFHSFPVLVAAWFWNIPIVLFESNSIPGKVNRVFSPYSMFSAIYFSKAQNRLKGRCIEVSMPVWRRQKISKPEARVHFSLFQDRFTFLVFGGSQGANAINQVFIEALTALEPKHQVIHITGNSSSVEQVRLAYELLGVKACVKCFEDKMDFAWMAADVAISRAGAATLAEMLFFEVPSILIPYPTATDQHQKENAYFMEQEVGGAICLEENQMTAHLLVELLERMKDAKRLQAMKQAMITFKEKSKRKELSDLVEELILKRNV